MLPKLQNHSPANRPYVDFVDAILIRDVVKAMQFLQKKPFYKNVFIDFVVSTAKQGRLVKSTAKQGRHIGIMIRASSSSALASGAQWLGGRLLDSRPRGRGFEPQKLHCVVVLEEDTFILANNSTGSTQKDPSLLK